MEDTEQYPPRVCRICLESVLPTFQSSEFLQKPRVVYESSDPECGRLFSPCQCKGSSRYVHEGCLQAWRHAGPKFGTRNFWQCPTCGFQYRLERLTWARWISSATMQLILTIAILMLTVFLLGFIADPIIDFYVGPVEVDLVENDSSWLAHFLKGLTSLGLLSFLKAFFALSPSVWSLRSIATGRNSGRNRAAQRNWLIIMVGIGTFLWAVYKGVRAWSRRVLERAGAKVMDVPLPGEDVPTSLLSRAWVPIPFLFCFLLFFPLHFFRFSFPNFFKSKYPFFMDILPAGSRLAVVRSQLAPSSGSESSGTPPRTPPSTPPVAAKEPFPDYDEAECDTVATERAAERADAEAWTTAFGKALQTQIRQTQIDPSMIPYVPSNPSERSQVVFERMKDLLSNPQMRPQTRRQFITLSNITLQINQVIFHQNPEFLAPKETSDAKLLTETILTHIAWIDSMLTALCQTMQYITSVLGEIERRDIPVYQKLQEMAAAVAVNLKKPRALERQLLELYLELFDEWVHTPFLRLRNHQILVEQTSCLAREELSRQIIAIWDITSRCIESYATYTWGTVTIRDEFFAPSVDKLNMATDLWEQCWNKDMETEDTPESGWTYPQLTIYK
ncbi:unnamed protein product [Penicillium salamii]|uniref:RING-CH-type domain-containing protein n=1 Tax=Penicillium salamii TaxID=1612424 RepID=A0A9W4JJI6_9EURO|nr:unnamed protein product [Penicillium salamii]CAG8353893.1 unnamed protein product [Penicillium salamii]CAG8358523.1 unnamed protein product [Penicillium salamii]CAG8403301.1 unnamed protein product [Penicillium salamii]